MLNARANVSLIIAAAQKAKADADLAAEQNLATVEATPASEFRDGSWLSWISGGIGDFFGMIGSAWDSVTGFIGDAWDVVSDFATAIYDIGAEIIDLGLDLAGRTWDELVYGFNALMQMWAEWDWYQGGGAVGVNLAFTGGGVWPILGPVGSGGLRHGWSPGPLATSLRRC